MQKLRTLTCSGVGELLGEDCRTFLSPGCAVQSGHTNFSIFFTWSGVTHARWVEPTCGEGHNSAMHYFLNIEAIHKDKIGYDLVCYQVTSPNIYRQPNVRDMFTSTEAKLGPNLFARQQNAIKTSLPTKCTRKATRYIEPTNLCRFHIAPSSRRDCMASHTCSNCTQYSGEKNYL